MAWDGSAPAMRAKGELHWHPAPLSAHPCLTVIAGEASCSVTHLRYRVSPDGRLTAIGAYVPPRRLEVVDE